MKTALLAALAALPILAVSSSGCQTLPARDVMTAKTLARGTHAEACELVERLHDTAVLTGGKFNAAKRACIQADVAIDAAEAALARGDEADARAQLSAANAALATVQTLTEGK